MNYLSVCSGIEAATVAWHHMGWKPLGFSEIEKFPSQVLEHHYPTVPNLGDMTKYKEWNLDGTIGLLVGGTPCQAFSVAGLRQGIADPRGNLALTYVGLLDHFRPKWFVWENVPGVLSSNKGADFSAFLSAVVQCGYGFAYRVLDAQYFGIAQRRRRVFVVGCFGSWQSAAEVLFESDCLSGNTKKGRKTREEVTTNFVPSIANCLETTCNDYSRADGFNMITQPTISFDERNIQFFSNQNYTTCPTLTATDNKGAKAVCYENHPIQNMAVRRLTEVECERLQGFPDNYTNIKENCPSGPRYKALGNSMAVNVMKWIGERINSYEQSRR